jgi:AraC-like DNA-binding protein
MNDFRLLINGKLVEGAGTLDVINPATGRTLTVARRVERAKELLQAGTELSLAQVAADVGFSDQSQLCHHFKRLVGVTPGQFRTPARIA